MSVNPKNILKIVSEHFGNHQPSTISSNDYEFANLLIKEIERKLNLGTTINFDKLLLDGIFLICNKNNQF